MGKVSILTTDETLEEGIERIREGLREKPNPEHTPASMRVRDVRTLVSVFQPRSLEGRTAEDEAHIKALMDAIGSKDKPKVLRPVSV